MRFPKLLWIFAALATSSCNLVRGKCTYELRTLDAIGSVTQNGTELVSAQLSLSEQRGSLQGQALLWLVTGDQLKGHVLSASFKDSSNPSQVLLDLPVASASLPEISRGAVSSATGATLAGFHDILAAGRGIVEIHTDMSSQPTITVQLTPANATDWIRPYCS
jgi:hypothetical protein